MDHAPNSDTFQKHYLNRNVCADLWAIHRNQQPQHELVKQAVSHGSATDSRRPVDLTPEQAEAVKFDPQYQRLSQLLYSLPRGSEQRPEVVKRRKALLGRLRDEAIKKVREEWDRDQAVDDIDRQMEGRSFDAQASRDVARALRPMSRAQGAMLGALEAPLPLTGELDAIFQRRTSAVKAIMSYCTVEEDPSMSNKMMGARPLQVAPKQVATKQVATVPKLATEPKAAPLELARTIRRSVFGRVRSVERCFVCVAKALLLQPDDANLDILTRPFSSHGSLTRHFTSVHLRSIDPNAIGECPICPGMKLVDKMHLQKHAESVHGIRTQSVKK